MSEAPSEQLRVFISYSRRDCAVFAEDLVDGLELAGFSALLDRQDIAAGEDWEKRIESLIAESDTVLFVLSPESVRSKVCEWEVSRALEQSKRIVAVVAIPVPDSDVPASLAKLNFVNFTDKSFARALRELSPALSTDVVWLREHTRLADLARRWEGRARPDVLLLRGPELAAAQQWLIAGDLSTTQPTELHRRYIEASSNFEQLEHQSELQRLSEVAREQAAKEEALRREAEALRSRSRRTTLGLIGSLGLTALSGGLAYWGVTAEARFRSEQQRAEEAKQRSIDTFIENESKRDDIEGQLIAYSAVTGFPSVGAELSPYARLAIEALDVRDRSIYQSLVEGHSKAPGSQSLTQSMNGEVYLWHPSPTRRLFGMVIGVTVDNDRIDLRNSLNDARAWSDLFSRAGINHRLLVDPSSAEVRALTDPGVIYELLNADIGPVAMSDALFLFVYCGIGVYDEGRRLIMFKDTKFDTLERFRQTTANLDHIITGCAKRISASVLIIDAAFPDVVERKVIQGA